MKNGKLSTAPVSAKLLMTVLLCIVGLIYLSMLLQVYQDTAMKPSLIAEGYGEMEVMELAHHTHIYLPYYALYLFALPVSLFMFSSYSERLKIVAVLLPYTVIVIDIASMWLVPYAHRGFFSYVLWGAGTGLAMMFFALFTLNVYDIWLRGRRRGSVGEA